jgi:hypothetical protein
VASGMEGSAMKHLPWWFRQTKCLTMATSPTKVVTMAIEQGVFCNGVFDDGDSTICLFMSQTRRVIPVKETAVKSSRLNG